MGFGAKTSKSVCGPAFMLPMRRRTLRSAPESDGTEYLRETFQDSGLLS